MKKIRITHLALDEYRSALEGKSIPEGDGLNMILTITVAKDERVSDLLKIIEDHTEMVEPSVCAASERPEA